jgi:hypothetical protein
MKKLFAALFLLTLCAGFAHAGILLGNGLLVTVGTNSPTFSTNGGTNSCTISVTY